MYELRHMDALDLLAGLEPGRVDAIVTDPPYGTTHAEWDKAPDWPTFFNACWRVLKHNGVIVVCSQNPVAAEIICSQRKFYRYEWVWEKTLAVGILNANRMPLRAHELLLVFYRSLPLWNKVTLDNQRGKPYAGKGRVHKTAVYDGELLACSSSSDGSRCPRDVLRFSRPTHSLHPTQKPEELIRYIIEQYTHPGHLVVAPYAGSGTTLAAAVSCGRRAIGSEISPDYYAKACARLSALTVPVSFPGHT